MRKIFTHGRDLAVLLVLLVLTGRPARAADSEQLVTRYGKLDAVSKDETTSVRYQGRVIAKLEAEYVIFGRITSDAQHEFVIVSAWHPGLNCHYFFHLVDLAPDGSAVVSKDFGECNELVGAGFLAGSPIVHLKSPFVEGNPIEATSYVWKNGAIRKAFSSTDQCLSLDYAVKTSAKRVTGEVERQVTGGPRLQFFSAPDETCAKKGVFVIAGDRVTASLTYEDYVHVTYTHPKTGLRHDGWVSSGRLAASNGK